MKKLSIVFFLLTLLTAALSGCGSERDEALLGIWESYDSAGFRTVFNSDGTGIRGIPEGEMYTFTWSTSAGNRLNINLDQRIGDYIQNERWNYTINDGALTIRSRQIDGRTDNYVRLEIDSILVGTWEWDSDPNWRYVFHANGTGNRGIEGEYLETFTWATGARSLLNIDFDGVSIFGVRDERWTYSIVNNSLVLSSRQGGDTFSYIRRPGENIQPETPSIGASL